MPGPSIPGQPGCIAETVEERETDHGWVYTVSLTRSRPVGEGQMTTKHIVRLDWSDHDHWCGGGTSPSRVIEALVESLAEARGDQGLPATFDASTARRMAPGLEERMLQRFGGA